MNEERRHWTTEDLELYHDGEFDAGRRSELGEALLRDPALRERYGVVCRVDDDLRAAFLGKRGGRQREPPIIRLVSLPAAAAACLSFAAGLTWWYASSRSVTDGRLQGDLYADADRTFEPLYKAVRVVFSLPIKVLRQSLLVSV